MKSLLHVFFSMESTVTASVLSKYSTSGLFKESQVDMDSSMDSESPSDSVGKKSMLQEEVVVMVGRGASVF